MLSLELWRVWVDEYRMYVDGVFGGEVGFRNGNSLYHKCEWPVVILALRVKRSMGR